MSRIEPNQRQRTSTASAPRQPLWLGRRPLALTVTSLVTGWMTVAAVAALALGAASCSDAGLVKVPPPAPPVFDNKLTVKGTYCTDPAEEISFPVKILYVLDQSASLQCTDQFFRRFDAIQQSMQNLDGNPDVSFGFIGFSSRLDIIDFTADRTQLDPYLSPATARAGTATDYQGALATTIRVLEEDMVEVGAAERARTRYVVVFLSDGNPEPRCNQGCEDDNDFCGDGQDNDGDGLVDASDPNCANIDDNVLHPDNLYGVCNFQGEIEEGDYVDMQGLCPEYNQPPQILQRVSQIVDLKEAYSVGNVTVNTVLLFSSEPVANAICIDVGLFGYERERALDLLQAMADTGNGTFRDVNLSVQNDQFLDFNFTALGSPQWLTSFLASNQNALEKGGIQLDSDGDGIPDIVEQDPTLDTSPNSIDSDRTSGDGYNDLVEWRWMGRGFDPLDNSLPAISCTGEGLEDRDGDGLLNCEEELIGTDPFSFDSDLDGMPDRHELVAGTDPAKPDAFEDVDFDAITNADEIRGGTDPLVPDEETYRTERMRYGLTDLGDVEVRNPTGSGSETRHCYDFVVDDIRMVTTQFPADRGRNRIMFHVLERPVQLSASQSSAFVACVEAYYNGETDKFPEGGIVDMSIDFWTEKLETLALRLDAIAQCRGLDLASMNRGDVLTTANDCLSNKVVIGRIVYPRDEMNALVNKYIAGNLAPQSPAFPRHPSHIFVPAGAFDPDVDCRKPKEIENLFSYLDLIADTCAECYAPDPAADPGVSP